MQLHHKPLQPWTQKQEAFVSHLYFQHAYYLLAMHFWIMTQKYGGPHDLAY